MRKGRKRKIMCFAGAILVLWIIFAQSCMKMRISDQKAKKQIKAAGVNLSTETIKVKGANLHYAKTGNDTLPTLFFVHGSPGSWDAFSIYMQDKELLAKYRMISIDRPGFGYSDFGEAKNILEQSKIIGPLLKRLDNGKPLHIIGHSLGGPLAVMLVADNPATFTTMVLLAASVDPDKEPKEKWRGFLYKTPFQYLLPGAFRPSNNEIWMAKKELIPLANEFPLITCNVWLVHGDADKFVPVGNVAYAEKLLINAQFIKTVILPGAPHFIPWAPWYKNIKEILLNLP